MYWQIQSVPCINTLATFTGKCVSTNKCQMPQVILSTHLNVHWYDKK